MSMAPAPSPIIDYGTKRPLSDRINFRLLTIVAIFSLLVGIPVYNFVKIQVTHGIEKDGDLFRVDLKKMGYFPFDEMAGSVSDVPPDFRKLDGKEVALEGFIAPTDVSGPQVDHFQLVYNVAKCCYGGPPKVQERVFAFVPNGTIDYTDAEIRAIGTLHVMLNKDKDTGKILTVYVMDVKRVEPL
jgi:hypothetical protein